MRRVIREPSPIWFERVVAGAGFAGVERFAREFDVETISARADLSCGNQSNCSAMSTTITTLPKELRDRAERARRCVLVGRAGRRAAFERRTDDQGPLSSARR